MPCRQKGAVRFSKNTVSLFNNKKRFCEKTAGSGIILCRRKTAQNVLNSGAKSAQPAIKAMPCGFAGVYAAGRLRALYGRPGVLQKGEIPLYFVLLFWQNSRNFAGKAARLPPRRFCATQRRVLHYIIRRCFAPGGR